MRVQKPIRDPVGVLLSGVILAALVGCQTDSQSNLPPRPSPSAAVRWVKASDEKVNLGRATFGTCMGCHGPAGEGRIGIGPRIASESYLAAASDNFLIETIAKGRDGTTMIPWGVSLGRDKLEALVAFLRSLHPVEAAALDESPLNGNVDNGAKIFREICSGCHGRSGAGYQETANGTGIGRHAFLRTASDGFMRYIIKHGKTLTKMRGFSTEEATAIANLSSQDIDDTITYLRRSAW